MTFRSGNCFKVWTNSTDATLAALCRGLLFRRLYKTIDLTNRCDGAGARQAFTTAAADVRAAGGDADYDLFYDEPADTPYEAYRSDSNADSASEVMVIDSTSAAAHFTSISPMTQAMNRQLMFRRIHVKAEWRDLVRRSVDAAIGA